MKKNIKILSVAEFENFCQSGLDFADFDVDDAVYGAVDDKPFFVRNNGCYYEMWVFEDNMWKDVTETLEAYGLEEVYNTSSDTLDKK